LRDITGASLQEIGQEFGHRHHTTALHAIRKIEEMCHSDGALDCAIRGLMDDIALRATNPQESLFPWNERMPPLR
jgi:chromosomal replication initiator protein